MNSQMRKHSERCSVSPKAIDLISAKDVIRSQSPDPNPLVHMPVASSFKLSEIPL